MLLYSVMLALSCAMRVLMNARSTLSMEWNIADDVQKRVVAAQRNVVPWQVLMLKKN